MTVGQKRGRCALARIDMAMEQAFRARRSSTLSRPHKPCRSSVCELNLQLSVFPEMKRPGKYRLSLTYMVRKQAIGKGGAELDNKYEKITAPQSVRGH
jgi:hypothetical protein